jgi:hypothetical protein
MGAPPAPVVRKGAGMGLIVGLVLGALVLAAGGYFGYKKFFGPKEPGQEMAQTQPPESRPQPAMETPAQQPAESSQPQTPVDAGSGQAAPVQGYEAQPPAQTPSQPQSGGSRPSAPAAQKPQTPVYTQQPVQQSTPVSIPPPPPRNEPVSRPPSQPAAQPQERSFPPAPVTQTPPTPSAPSTPTVKRYTGPSSGMLMWLGKLDKNGVVTIDGSQASTGTLTGTLPGVPVTLETDLTNIGFAEMPSPSNGWKKVTLRSKKSQNIVISIRWKVLD